MENQKVVDISSADVLGSLDDIVSTPDVKYVTVVVPEWGGKKVRLGSLSAGEMIEFVESNEGPGKKSANVRLVMQSLVNANGERIGDMKLLDQLKKKNSEVIVRLAGECLKLNGFDEAAKKLLGNASSEAPTGDSPTV